MTMTLKNHDIILLGAEIMNTMQKNNIQKDRIILIINLLFVFIIILFLLSSFCSSIFWPKDIFAGENRYAEKYSNINIKDFYNKKTQDNIEKVLSDQLLFSGKFRSLNNIIKGIIVKNYIDLFLEEDDIKYLNSDGITFYGKNNLVYYYRNLADLKDALDSKINNYNELITKYNKVEFYFYYIEKDTDINFINNDKTGIYEYIEKEIRSNNIGRFKIDNFEQFKKYFYETDHHWNYKGSYEGYKEVLRLLGLKDNSLVGEEKCLDIYWSGSKAKSSIYNKILLENFCAYEFGFDEMTILINGIKENYGHQEEYLNGKSSEEISYGAFYGGDDGEIIFDTGNSNKENILVIGESYDNAILKLIASHFNKTISIDLRNYVHCMDKEFNFSEYINDYNIKKVLFIGNVDFYTMEEFKIKGDNYYGV